MGSSVRLSGWHRLFLVLAFLYFVLVALFIANSIPTAEDRQRTRLFDTVNLIREHRPNYFSESWTFKVVDSIIQEGTDQWLAQVHDRFQGQIDFSPIEQKYQEDLHNLSRDQRKTVLFGLCLWAIPVGLVYLLGVSVAWIIAGFRGPNRSAHN